MRERRESERAIAGLAAQDAEFVERELIKWSANERDRLRRELRERFGFSLGHSEDGYVCRFERPARRPKSPEGAARWVDLFVHVVAFEEALRAMRAVAAYHPDPDRAGQVCNAFLDVMRESPAIYGAVAEAGFEPTVREYAAAMLAAWTRSHLRKDFNPKLRRALTADGWENELVNAASLAWADRDPDAPLKRPTRFRDSLPPKKPGGRRRRADAPPDLVNLVSAALQGEDITTKKVEDEPPEHGLADFAVREAMMSKARGAGLTARELELYAFFLQNPAATKREAADHFGISAETVKKHKRAARNKLRSA